MRKLIINRKKWLKVLFLIFFTSLFLSFLGMVYLFLTENSRENVVRKYSSKSENPILNILFLGIDELNDRFNGRSDSIILVSLNSKTKQVKIISFMRDTLVKIPNHGFDRLNAAYAFGGANLTLITIRYNFDLKIDRYVSVDFVGFETIIDIIGGVTLDLSYDEVKYINDESSSKKKLSSPGKNKLNGNQALQYSRNRNSAGSDYDRTKRQRKLLSALANQVKLLKYSELIKLFFSVMKFVKTNFKMGEIKDLLNMNEEYSQFSISTFRIPVDGNVKNSTKNGKMVLEIIDIKKTIEDINKFIYKT
ncbi:MAG: LytR family transcriptional regulator [Candidatus Improbicoccus pseudotrichonymphae]|uniref:LytR family transcriptional regulator n=1 Tax=Candidatus Improbicoccus pseudotrichonymphae TaxID=3033792 RepID=A0AA48I3I6_9FIRM|nr:MAG: LytR family transcriptional regulator [Candidatus Improbicoccus pseudotrichonymphae]